MTQLATQPVSSTGPRAPQIALVGNPNTGKSALFNRLTGARQRVGNYPGLTIEKKVGALKLDAMGSTANVIDLPGLYSLAALSPDERVVLEVLLGHVPGTRRPDLIVCVLDATNLRRNLFLATQVAEVGLPMVIALNMWDEAETKQLRVDVGALSARLGVPVVATAAAKGQGVEELKAAMSDALKRQPKMQCVAWPRPVEDAIHKLHKGLDGLTNRAIDITEAQRLLFDMESSLADELHLSEGEQQPLLKAAREEIRHGGYDPAHVETAVRYPWIDNLLVGLNEPPGQPRRGKSESIDDLLTHRVFGLTIFMAVMYVVFQSIYTLAGPFMDGIEYVFGALGETVGAWFEGSPILQSMMVDGVIAGVGGVLVFLPQIVILFFFITLLEDVGYMPRAAFLMDRLFGWCGLSGKSFVPMLSSFACAVPGIMSARTLAEPKARLTTILVCPLMSCSARLPVYVLLIGAFIEPVYGASVAGITLFAMHFVGLAIAIPVAFIMNRLVLRGRRTPFVLEMPPYRIPTMRDVSWRVYGRAKEFVVRAGTIIFALSILIWAMCYFPRSEDVATTTTARIVSEVATERGVSAEAAEKIVFGDEELAGTLDAELLASPDMFKTMMQMIRSGRAQQAWGDGDFQTHIEQAIDAAYLEQSIMGRLGQSVQPVFAPAGFDWKITVGVLSSFPAREVIISTLGIVYSLGADVDEEDSGLRSAMEASKWPDGKPVFTPIVAIAVMVFFALCSQCAATLVAIARESNWKWAVFSFVYMTVLAWVGAVVVYQVGTAWFA
ncbi:MAG: ferrous iron transport protein B [Phycisphaeraceae bacterium]